MIQMKIRNISVILVMLFMVFSINSESYSKKMKMDVKIKTNKGEINLRLFPEKSPVTVASFVNLIKHGYYNGLKFHRVIEDFMAQGGDPTGTGMGGPGYRFEDEVKNGLDFSIPGKLAMTIGQSRLFLKNPYATHSVQFMPAINGCINVPLCPSRLFSICGK